MQFLVCFWVNILQVTLSRFTGTACIQLEYLLTVHPHPVAINQAVRYDIQHKLVIGFAGTEESDVSPGQLLLALSLLLLLLHVKNDAFVEDEETFNRSSRCSFIL